MSGDEPIGPIEAAGILTGVLPRRRPARLLLAVSGGADSTALLYLFAQARDILPGLDLHVATVDHGLRPEAAAEARWVAALAAAHAMPHATLRWRPPALSGNIPAAARDARYGLLAAHARSIGAQCVLTAHHLDDQIETHLLAAERGGVGSALAGMRDLRALRPGIVLARPFLAVPARRLKDTLRAAGQDWLSDPTNDDTDYARVRLRHALRDGRCDAGEAAARQQAAAALRAGRDAALARGMADLADGGRLAVMPDGGVRLDLEALADWPDTLRHALLARAITAAAGAAYPPAAHAVRRLPVLAGAPAATLCGAQLVRRDGELLIFREFGREGRFGVEPLGDGMVWFDRRFEVPDGAGLSAYGTTGRGHARARTLPVRRSADGGVVAAHAALRIDRAERLACVQTVSWRLAADLPGDPLREDRGGRTPKIQMPWAQNAPIATLPVGNQMADHYFDRDGQAVASGPVTPYGAAALIQDG